MSQFGSFWSMLQFANHSSQIDDMLGNPYTTFEQLLDDDNIISEFKSMNPKLLEYCTNDRLKKLFSFIVEEPSQDADRNRGYKYPFVACEILTSDVNTIMSAFFGRNPNGGNKAPKKAVQKDIPEFTDFEPFVSGPEENKNDSQEEAAPETETKPVSDQETPAEPEKKEEGEKQEVENQEPEKQETEKQEPEKQETEKQETEKQETEKQEPEKQEPEKQDTEAEKAIEAEQENQENKPPVEADKPTSESTQQSEPSGEEAQTSQETSEESEKKPAETEESKPVNIADDIEEVKSEEADDFGEPDLAEYFFDFLNAKELNVTLVGYFCRFFNILLMRRTTEIVEYLWTRPEVVNRLIDHLEFKAIAECLVRVISLEQATVSALDNFIDARLKALTKIAQIFESFEEGGDLEKVSNASFVLYELVNKRPNLNCGAQIEEHFNSKGFLDIIYNNALRVEPLAPHVLNVICALVQLNLLNKNIARPQSNSDEVPEDIVISEPENELHVQYLGDNLSKFAAYLDMDTNRVLSVSYGNPTLPLGSARLRIVDIVANAAKLNNTRINKEICSNAMFSQFMTLMTKFEWNNILHNIIEKLFTSLIEGPPGTLRHHLLHEAKLLEFLHMSTRDTTYKFDNSKRRPTRRGYLGHITKIARVLEKQAQIEAEIKEYITDDKWNEFDDTYFVPSVKAENQDLAGFTRKVSEDIIEDNIHVGSLDDIHHKYNSFYTHPATNDDEEVEEEDPEIIEREDDEVSPQKEVNTNYDSLDDYGKSSETWSKREADETNTLAHSDKKLWNSTLKLGPDAFVENAPVEVEANKYLNLNREVTIIVVEANQEPIVHEYSNNQYWAKPLDKSISVEDLFEEFGM